MDYAYVPIEKQVRDKVRALKGSESYSRYIDRLMRSGNKQND